MPARVVHGADVSLPRAQFIAPQRVACARGQREDQIHAAGPHPVDVHDAFPAAHLHEPVGPIGGPVARGPPEPQGSRGAGFLLHDKAAGDRSPQSAGARQFVHNLVERMADDVVHPLFRRLVHEGIDAGLAVGQGVEPSAQGGGIARFRPCAHLTIGIVQDIGPARERGELDGDRAVLALQETGVVIGGPLDDQAARMAGQGRARNSGGAFIIAPMNRGRV